jgi:predicted phosphate transport protein (TIGR00153 family)
MALRRFRVLPREEGFFDLFERASANIVAAAELLLSMVAYYDDPEAGAMAIKEREHVGDEITHTIMRSLNTTFVTPFDREDIHDLASQMDNILDDTDAAADLFVLHRISEPLSGMRDQAEILVQTTKQVDEAIKRLRTPSALEPFLGRLHTLEDQGDRIFRKMTATLFSGRFEALDVLRLKEVVDQLEQAIDNCESVANTLETIAVKHA